MLSMMKCSGVLGFAAIMSSMAVIARADPMPYSATDANTQLLYHYDETTGAAALDSSGHNRNATLGSVVGITRQAGQSAAFGNDIKTSAGLANHITYVDSGQGQNSFLYTGGTSGTKDFTLEMWMKPVNLPTTGEQTLAALQVRTSAGGEATTYDWRLSIVNTSSYLQGVMLVHNSASPYIPLTVSKGATTKSYDWQSGTWYHLALVVHLDFDTPANTYEKFYITPAGVETADLIRTQNVPLVVQAANVYDRALLVGNRYGSSGNDYFPGEIDEVRWSDTLRTDFTTLVPEPASMGLMLLGGLLLLKRQKQ